MELIELRGSCPRCLGQQATSACLCSLCAKELAPLLGFVAPFTYEGAAATLVKACKKGGCSWLAQGMAGWMALQLLALPSLWSIDYIVPTPISAQRYFQRGYNQSLLLAEALSSLLSVPCLSLLGRYSGGCSQTHLSQWNRGQLSQQQFVLREHCRPQSTLLLVDDVLTTGSTLRCCAQTLLPLDPKGIYGLTFCTTRRTLPTSKGN